MLLGALEEPAPTPEPEQQEPTIKTETTVQDAPEAEAATAPEPAEVATTPEPAEVATAPEPAEVRSVELDEGAAVAVEQARAAAVEVAGPAVGEHLGVEADDEGVVTHSFATTETGYVGWRWAVTVARAPGSEVVTIDEVVLLPGSGALLAPAWVPWSERVQPGDLGPGDLLPPASDDPRLVPSYADVDADVLPFSLHRELGLGRPRVLSLDGRADAAQRWHDGLAGPDTPQAKAAPGRCGDCGFLAPLAGALGRVFGACANGMSPDDGRVVALTHGCGAHSETVVEVPESAYAGMAVEDDEFEVVDRARILDEPADVAGEQVLPGSGAMGAEADEPFEGLDEADGEDEVAPLDGVLVPAEAVEDL